MAKNAKSLTTTLIAGLRADCLPIVRAIESAPATTQNHYSDYMAVLGAIQNRTIAQLCACALIDAGANAAGVRDAVHALGLLNK